MKNFTIAIIFLLVFTPSVFADFTVFYDKDTLEVVFADNPDYIVLSEEDEVQLEQVVLPGELEDYNFTESLYDYQIKNGKFVINTKKISDQENKEKEITDKKDKKDADFESAKIKLMSEVWEPLTNDEVDSLK